MRYSLYPGYVTEYDLRADVPKHLEALQGTRHGSTREWTLRVPHHACLGTSGHAGRSRRGPLRWRPDGAIRITQGWIRAECPGALKDIQGVADGARTVWASGLRLRKLGKEIERGRRQFTQFAAKGSAAWGGGGGGGGGGVGGGRRFRPRASSSLDPTRIS